VTAAAGFAPWRGAAGGAVQLTARLSHPNTVAVFDYGRTPDGVFYYAMEYLDGTNLVQGTPLYLSPVEVCSHHLHTRPVPPSEKLGRALPEPIEALVLACLEKDRARRPASASELRERLSALAQAFPWSEDEARAWWERWRERPDRVAGPQDAFSGTLAVSLLGRSS